MNALLADIIKSDLGFSRPFLSHGRGLSGERANVSVGQEDGELLQRAGRIGPGPYAAHRRNSRSRLRRIRHCRCGP